MAFRGNWFYEENDQWPGQALGLKLKGDGAKLLFDGKSDFQHVQVFESETWGKVLLLDGVVQVTERDECSYQEMLAHLPMFSHPNPRRVLIVGGGDGGMLREVCKHRSVQEVVQCEIDPLCVAVSKKWFPALSCRYPREIEGVVEIDDMDQPKKRRVEEKDANMGGSAHTGGPKITVKVADAFHYIKTSPDGSFDVVIVDSSDPVGPAAKLFTAEFYQDVARILVRGDEETGLGGGVLASQGESLWLNQDLMCEMQGTNGKYFAQAKYASVQVPTYPSGQICLFIAKVGAGAGTDSGKMGDIEHAARAPSAETLYNYDTDDSVLRYYSARMHTAAFCLPAFIEKKLYGKKKA